MLTGTGCNGDICTCEITTGEVRDKVSRLTGHLGGFGVVISATGFAAGFLTLGEIGPLLLKTYFLGEVAGATDARRA